MFWSLVNLAQMLQFALKMVKYLGHVVSAKEVQTNPKKVTAVEQFPTPHDVKTLYHSWDSPPIT